MTKRENSWAKILGKVLETNQDNLLNKATELIKSNFADFFKLDTKTNRKPQYNCKHQLNYDQKDKQKDYTTTSSKRNGTSPKVKEGQLIQSCRQYVLVLLFWYDPTTALKSDFPMGVKEELKPP